MNIKMTVAFVCLLMGLTMTALYFVSASKEEKGKAVQSESINLAMRQAAHNLYQLNCDSTSSIPPVEVMAENTYSLLLNESIDYSSLADLLNQAFIDYDIPLNYEVTVKDCNTDLILIGYNDYAFNSGQTPCVSREIFSDCNILGLTFRSKASDHSKYIIGAIFFFLLGLGIWLLKKTSPVGTIDSSTEKIATSFNSIHLANSCFTPKDLTIKVNDGNKKLTFRESKLLEYFFNHPNQLLNREDIKLHVWEDEGVIIGRSVDVFVSRLRKIRKDDEGLKIKNVHGVGYRLEVK